MSPSAPTRSPRRRALAAVAAASLTAAAVVVAVPGAGPASAVSRGGIVVAEGQPAQANYPPIPGNMPSSGVLNFFPDDCGSPDTTPPIAVGTGAGSGFCDNVPIDVKPPNVDANTPWVVEIEVSWDDPAGANDIDVVLFDDEQVRKREGSTGYTPFGEAATADNPEKIRTYLLTLGRYNLVVLNYVGPNTGYTVTARMVIGEAFQNPFELLDDPPAPSVDPSGGDAGGTAEAFADLSGSEGFDTFPGFQGFNELTIVPDAGFGDELAASGISELPPTPFAGSVGRIADSRPGPASGVLMFIWLVLLPAALVGGAATVMMRRTRSGAGFA